MTSTRATSTPTATLLPKASCPATRSPGYRWRRSSPLNAGHATARATIVQRPRFLAISEFGPGAFIYHEGARYEVNRVSLPARDDGTGVSISEIKRCEACGYLHDSNGSTSHEICEHCGSASLQTMSQHDEAPGCQDPPP